MSYRPPIAIRLAHGRPLGVGLLAALLCACSDNASSSPPRPLFLDAQDVLGEVPGGIAFASEVRGVAGVALDVDGDGQLDVAAVDPVGGLDLLLREPSGALVLRSERVPAGLPAGLRAVVAGDVNADGRADLIVGGDGGLTILSRN